MAKRLRKLMAALVACVMVIGALSVSAFAEGETFDPNGEYNAFLQIQFGGSWIFRDSYTTPNTGANTDYEFKNGLSTYNAGVGTAVEGTFKDVVLAGNGTYTVSLENPDLGDSTTCFNIIGVSTNIPGDGADKVKFTDMKISVNDNAMTSYTYPEATFSDEDIDKGYLTALGVNIWNKETCADANAVLGDVDAWPAQPVTKVSITFTVSGFDYDNESAVEETTTVAPSEEETTTTAAAAETTTIKDDSTGFPTWAYIVIAVAVVVVVVIIVVAASSKKKKAK